MNTLALLHVAKRDLGLDEDSYRAVLNRVTGKTSSRDMNASERDAVFAEFRRLGFRPASRSSRTRLEGRYAAKLQALWIAGWNLCVVTNRNDAALLAFVKRQTGVDHTRFLHHADDAAKAIEALKGWLAREAGVDWSDGGHRPAYAGRESFKIAWAQWEMLEPDGNIRGFWEQVRAIAPGIDWNACRERDWQPVMNAFGERLRKAKTGPK